MLTSDGRLIFKYRSRYPQDGFKSIEEVRDWVYTFNEGTSILFFIPRKEVNKNDKSFSNR